MSDTQLKNTEVPTEQADPNGGEAVKAFRPQHVDFIELMFFAYRDFTGDPDIILNRDGFGRAHHRIIHFVGRNPGITVAGLLAILGITKQSLARVLKELIERGLVEQRSGTDDRRQRHLHLTADGYGLAERLAGPQSRRIAAAIDQISSKEAETIRAFLLGMIDEEKRGDVERLHKAGSPKAAKGG
jgi:DNA-binding MarR family transcriptional regulator